MHLAVITFKIFFSLLLLCAFSPTTVFAKEPKQPPREREMDFIVVRSQDCVENCLEWISAEGRITSASPERLKKLLKNLNGRKLPVVFHSPGGNVDASYEIGRMIRNAGLETAVGGTHLKGCPDADMRCRKAIAKNGTAVGSSFALGAHCYSACPFAFAGGVERSTSNWSALGVHQFTSIYNKMRVTVRIKYKIVNGKKVEVSRKEVHRKSREQYSEAGLTRESAEELAAYLKEMNVHQDLVGFVDGTAPKGIWVISPSRALQIGLITHEFTGNEKPGMPRCTADAAIDTPCHSRMKQAGPDQGQGNRVTI